MKLFSLDNIESASDMLICLVQKAYVNLLL